jgi:two-component system LytT family response regulator
MNWFLIVNDTKLKKEFQTFLKKNTEAIVYKTKIDTGLKNLETALNGLSPALQKNLIVINSSNHLNLIKLNDIVHCQSHHSYTQLHLINGKTITATKTLKQFEASINKKQFVRIHQSHLVNINYIEKYVKGEGGHLILNDGTKLPVATRKKEHLLNELENYI